MAARPGDQFCGACGSTLGAGLAPAALWSPLWPALLLCLVLMATIVMSNLLPLRGSTADIVWTLVHAAIVLVFVCVHRDSLRPLLRLGWATFPNGLAIAAAFGAMFLFMTTYVWVFVDLLGGRLVERGTDQSIWLALLLTSLAPAVIEELAFRGVIMTRFHQALGPREAMILQAVLFSVLHLLPAVFISHFVLGLLLGWLRVRTNSLYPPMIAHALWNGWCVVRDYAGLGS